MIQSEIKPYFVYTTFPDQACAEKITMMLLEQKLIACANINNDYKSFYCNDSQFIKTTETVALMKTNQENYEKIKDVLNKYHPYDCPCIVGWAITSINEPYGSWLQNQMLI